MTQTRKEENNGVQATYRHLWFGIRNLIHQKIRQYGLCRDMPKAAKEPDFFARGYGPLEEAWLVIHAEQ